MPRPKGSPNKITAEVKNKLQGVMDNVVSTLDKQFWGYGWGVEF